MVVSFLGPEATFTHQAAKKHFGLSATLVPHQTIPEVFAEVESERSAYGVVPIENSTEGIVSHTLDTFMNTDLQICAEILLDVSHQLLTKTGDLGAISKVYSHPQALAQCRRWLEANLSGVPLIDVSSTAHAAQLASQDERAAAIASELAASLYGLRVVQSNLQDMHGNMTRFLVIAAEDTEPTERDRTSIMFALRDQPGVLHLALSCFADKGINMSRIESRPSRCRAWDYLFFIDVEGHRGQSVVEAAIEDLRGACQFVKVLGSFPLASGGSVAKPQRGPDNALDS